MIIKGLQANFDGSGLGKLDGLNALTDRRYRPRWLTLWAGLFLAICFASLATPALAETRSLKLYYLHTGERAEITFKRNGKYVDSGLKKINKFLRDWRRNEPTKMDPRLLDLVWEVYKETGSKKHIHVISGYRSPATNNLLRKRGRGVAKKSQHTMGKALDFFIPGVSLRKLRNIGLKKGLGGVGYYPKSGSPFVHMDTGRVRHWPRMSRKELVRVFPKGDTLHVPTDGKPLARYNQAKATYERKIKGRDRIVVAKAEDIERKPRLFERLLGRDGEEDDDSTGVVAAPKPVRTTVEPAATATASQPETKPLGSIPGFETPTEPVPEPEVLDTPETILASLPANALPIPSIAPRITAVAEIEPSEETPSPETEVATLATAIETPGEAASAAQFDLARIYPAKRPQDEIPAALNLAERTDQTPSLSAYQRLEQAQSAALSPTEIQDLRQQVYAALRSNNGNSQKRPVPAAPIPETENIIVAAANIPVENTAPLQDPAPRSLSVTNLDPAPETVTDTFSNASPQNSESDITNDTREIETINTGSGVIVPLPNPARIEVAALSEPSDDILPIEPGVNSNDSAAIPSPNPVRPETGDVQTEIAALTVEPELDEQTVAGLAVPTPALRQSPEAIEEPIILASASAQALESRELILERFQAPGTDDRLVGKWALASNTTISQITEIQPPAYGRNVIRELPVTVLSRGFSRENIDRFTLGFTGSSLEFLDFKRFN